MLSTAAFIVNIIKIYIESAKVDFGHFSEVT